MTFERNESYMHLYAKKVLAGWLRVRMPRNIITQKGDRISWAVNGVIEEYCYVSAEHSLNNLSCLDRIIKDDSSEYPYSFEQAKRHGMIPLIVADIALKSPYWGTGGHECHQVIEIVHTNPVSQDKLSKYKSLKVDSVFEVSAHWILSQTSPPNLIDANVVLGHALHLDALAKPSNLFELMPPPPLICPPPSACPVAFDRLENIMDRAVAIIEPQGTRALLQQQGVLLALNDTCARIGILSGALFRMAQSRVDNIELALSTIMGKPIQVSLEPMAVPPHLRDSSMPPLICPAPLPPSISAPHPNRDVPF